MIVETGALLHPIAPSFSGDAFASNSGVRDCVAISSHQSRSFTVLEIACDQANYPLQFTMRRSIIHLA